MEPLKTIKAYSYKNELNIIKCNLSIDCPSNGYCYKDGNNQYGICCPSKENVCQLFSSPGYGECQNNTLSNKIMYYFDNLDLKCKPFLIGGCKGLNNNRFQSINDCQKFCFSTGCLPGELPLYTDHLGTLHYCTTQNPCPSPYKCRFDNIFRQHICCGRNDYLNQCLSPNLQPYLNIIEESGMTCHPSESFDTCPNNFICTKNKTTSLTYHCCGNDPLTLCPNGRKAALTHKDNSYQSVIKCPLFKDNQCPRGFECTDVTNIENTLHGFCCEKESKTIINIKKNIISITQKDCTSKNYQCDEGFYCHLFDNQKGICKSIENNIKPKNIILNYKKYNSKVNINKEIFLKKWLSINNNNTNVKLSSYYWKKSKDPLCPYMNSIVSCSPTDNKNVSVDKCKQLENETNEYNGWNIQSFCQFNIQYQMFACCSFEVPLFS
ncbi:Proteinase inhibitor I2, Kunitz metazoa domain and Cysteine-rich repeat and Lustrin, cysteine-rich repeated domain-containing protein [Strongyloides ratti]|uniref:Proteinase inhibitor I2, Kunitz metazoa domain and Cysteine-rich repeat and Lustrin, cysteine-rich repeated domain-containing protein n=1 Tax=Strongyloides ratti TaxID=34506 RepID=A0A090L0M0_STRRB|nr:Proteinase inhibitor I2, Kunitz metazoa domain and Cysteine-rich repeat and Lustrin, cysteine-rich repeated domain-containing protein [Strongyloides ratti]CEF63196.1 Proteinase inhibitor I2, Kunitz metazoa domain and Cysteine-rich repeat and Lustrin, cysteine-rich repeated domain-containing protein [Strongyloides ratti]